MKYSGQTEGNPEVWFSSAIFPCSIGGTGPKRGESE